MSLSVHIQTKSRRRHTTSTPWESIKSSLPRRATVSPLPSFSGPGSSSHSTGSSASATSQPARSHASSVDSSRHSTLSRRHSLGRPPPSSSTSASSSASSSTGASPSVHPHLLVPPPQYQAKRATPPITSNSSNSTSSSSSRSGAKPSSGVTGLSPSSVAKDKTVPMKELEKLLTDLKRENFDLKLRLFHLESAMTKEMDKFWLQSENERLQKEVEMKHGQVEALEDELTHLKETVRFGISCDSKGTQTDELPIMNAASSGPETRMDTPITTAIGATAEKTRFPSDAASFGLISRQLGRHVASAVAHEASKYEEIDCDQFQQRVHIASPQYRGRWRQ